VGGVGFQARSARRAIRSVRFEGLRKVRRGGVIRTHDPCAQEFAWFPTARLFYCGFSLPDSLGNLLSLKAQLQTSMRSGLTQFCHSPNGCVANGPLSAKDRHFVQLLSDAKQCNFSHAGDLLRRQYPNLLVSQTKVATDRCHSEGARKIVRPTGGISVSGARLPVG
jgi:hypothetical protein